MANRVRRANYRLTLPEGPLRRFRLPESFGDEVQAAAGERHSVPWSAALGWLCVCVGSWSLASGTVDPGALLDHTWQMPEQSRGGMVAGMWELGVRSAAEPRPVSPRPARPGPPRKPAVAETKWRVAPSSTLPKVTFPDVAVHSGGWGASASHSPSETEAELRRETLALDVDEVKRSSTKSEPSKPNDSAGSLDFGLGQMVRDLVADSPGALPRPVSPHHDPFEADFGAASLPNLSSVEAPAPPVTLRPRDVPRVDGEGPSPQPDVGSGAVSDARGAVSAGRGSVTWGGGCQRAFDASIQHIGDRPATKDASQADYMRALGRLDVASCGPRARTAIDVCVAVGDGRAIGVTVHTTPSSPALGECLLRKVRNLRFPASSGTDLVRTNYHVE